MPLLVNSISVEYPESSLFLGSLLMEILASFAPSTSRVALVVSRVGGATGVTLHRARLFAFSQFPVATRNRIDIVGKVTQKLGRLLEDCGVLRGTAGY